MQLRLDGSKCVAWCVCKPGQGVTVSIRYMSDLTTLSEAGLTDLDRALRGERLRRRGSWRQCERCGEKFLGRSDARFCATRCRVATHRTASKAQSDE